MTTERDYEPLQPQGGLHVKRFFERIVAGAIVVGGFALKFGFLLVKFGSIFISIAAYALIWGWRWGVGFVVLIFVHEMGHFIEARRRGLHASWPTFIPFWGAQVMIQRAGLTPWRDAMISLAGPFAGGIGAAACWALAVSQDSQLLRSLAFAGFLLNLINLAPIGFLDGGAVRRAVMELWRTPQLRFDGDVAVGGFAPDRSRAFIVVTFYSALVAVLVYGMVATHVPQHRL